MAVEPSTPLNKTMGNIVQKYSQTLQPHPQQTNTRQLEEDEKNGEFTCQICFETTPPNCGKRFKNGNKCSHPFCTDCVVNYIRARLEDCRTGVINCPGLGCGNSLDAEACAAMVGPEVFVRWCDALFVGGILRMDMSFCPDANCNTMIVNECGGIVQKSECPSCKKLFCFRCNKVWHAGFGCKDAPRDCDDVALGRLVEEKKWMRCPRCRYFVELTAGCLFIDCRCGTIFCYKCGAEVEQHACSCDNSLFWLWSFRFCLLIIWVVCMLTS